MHSSKSNYQNDSHDTYRSDFGSTQSRSSQNQGQPLEHELYPDVTAQQNPYAYGGSRQGYVQQDYGSTYGQPSATRRQPARQQARYTQPRRGQASPAHTTRQTAADLGQVDNSQVAGRVAYDEDGNLVVVKKEEKKAPVQMAAIVGSALSAVTSALFSSHIGIGGSLLTVAIGAAVSAAGTQLYTHIIAKSTDKLKSAIDNGSGGQQLVGVMDSSQLDSNGYGYEAEQTVYGYEAEEGTPTADGGRVAPQGMIDAAEEQHQRQVKRRGIIIVAIMALVAVIVAAGVVTWATQGNGIGTKTPSIVSTATSNTNENENANTNSALVAPGAATTAANSGDSGQEATTTGSAASGSTSSAANQGSASSAANASSPSTSAGTSGSGSGTSTGSGSSSAANATSTSGSGTSGTGASGTGTSGTGASTSSGSAASGAGANSAGTDTSSATNSETSGSASAGNATAADGTSGTTE